MKVSNVYHFSVSWGRSVSLQLFKFPVIVRTGRGRDLQLPQLPPHPALHQLHHHQLRVHPGAGGLRLRGAGAERQRGQIREVSVLEWSDVKILRFEDKQFAEEV